jgi:hypothetical protein
MDKETKEIKKLLQYLVALELFKGGVSLGDIAKRLGIGKQFVNAMLKGISRNKN